MRKSILSSLIISAILAGNAAALERKPVISSSSVIDWSKSVFVSDVNLDTERARISMPSGKRAAINFVDTKLPDLIKDPLLSLYVNSSQQIGDLLLANNITLEQLTKIIDEGKKSPGIFTDGSLTLKTTHTINLHEISSLMIKHHFPYENAKPIENVSSRTYTGIIIDARGKLDVHGEFMTDSVYPCFFPQIWDENMNLIYERNMGNPESEFKNGMIGYDWRDDETSYHSRIGSDPLHIKARKVYGHLRTDPVISREDALKILSVPENLKLLQEGKVVVLLDKENLTYSIKTDDKIQEYYAPFLDIKSYFPEYEEAPIINIKEDFIQLLYDLKFVADSAQLLDSELPKMANLARLLKDVNRDDAFTILVEGHTADVNKPVGQMNLSIARTQTIINELVKNGLARSIFSYKGYGGTQPVASNATPEGRALNRRVIITARPKATYIQRK
ncbi:OmpA family protein [Treponema ruminis]|uniref:Outer membrane protein OmpA-like peptidoglycan-associated protein n=1 Tax=Treponema ruminis TaxID=744515 RepID=A0A7W8G8F5_9SPIR|nr:OmpA family protein [Treponema ruminis]MBB5225793.1 outer membrane protein OmpA-like peptidoglycan-associated protein [Treponema ruminis]QSI02482.1 OmpA family protein [Treponema ruminis]